MNRPNRHRSSDRRHDSSSGRATRTRGATQGVVLAAVVASLVASGQFASDTSQRFDTHDDPTDTEFPWIPRAPGSVPG